MGRLMMTWMDNQPERATFASKLNEQKRRQKRRHFWAGLAFITFIGVWASIVLGVAILLWRHILGGCT